MPQKTTSSLVSVCIASYNYANYISDAIESVFSQNYTNWELIVVDDASTDGSVDIISTLLQRYPEKCTFVPLSKNKGVGYAFNQAFSRVSGKFIALLGSDDRMMPNRLERQVAYLNSHTNVAVVCSEVASIDAQGRRLEGKRLFSKPIIDIKAQLLDGNFINAPSVLFRSSLLNEHGMFNPELDYVQDYDYWLRIVDRHEIARIPEFLTEYRVHEKNLSSINDTSKLTYASLYETVIAILRAIKRLNENVDIGKLSDDEVVFKKIDLARKAMKTEEKYLGSFKYSIGIVYLILLDVMELDSSNEEAKTLLSDVYTEIGDFPRAGGASPISFKEYIQNTQFGVDAQTLVELAIQIRKNTGQTVDKTASAMVSTCKDLFPCGNERLDFYLKLIKFIVTEAMENVDYSKGRGIADETRLELQGLLLLLDEEKDADGLSQSIQEVKRTVTKIIDNDRKNLLQARDPGSVDEKQFNESIKDTKIAFLIHIAELFVHYSPVWYKLDRNSFLIVVHGTPFEQERTIEACRQHQLNYVLLRDVLVARHRFPYLISNHAVHLHNGIPLIQVIGECNIRFMYALGKGKHNISEWNSCYDMFLCFGPYHEHILAKYNVPAVQMGYPRYDIYFNETFDLSEFRQELNCPPERKTILWLPTWKELSSIDLYAEKMSSLMDQYNVVVKMHPLSIEEEPDRISKLERLNFSALITEVVDNVFLFSLADFVFCDYGGTAFGAIYLDKQLLFLNLPNASRDSLTGADSPDIVLRNDIVNIDISSFHSINDLLVSKKIWERQELVRKKLRKQYFSPYYGFSAEVAVAAIKHADTIIAMYKRDYTEDYHS